MEINIKYSSPYENIEIFIDSTKNIFSCNGIAVEINIYSFKEKLFDIVFSWDEINNVEDIKDSEFYMVSIKVDEESFFFSSNINFPENFQDFKNLLMEVKNG